MGHLHTGLVRAVPIETGLPIHNDRDTVSSRDNTDKVGTGKVGSKDMVDNMDCSSSEDTQTVTGT